MNTLLGFEVSYNYYDRGLIHKTLQKKRQTNISTSQHFTTSNAIYSEDSRKIKATLSSELAIKT